MERKPVNFNYCPDCGFSSNPIFERTNTYNNDSIYNSKVKAVCPRCNWETPEFTTVKACAKYWNTFEFPDDEVGIEVVPTVTSGYITREDYTPPCCDGPYTIITASTEDSNESN